MVEPIDQKKNVQFMALTLVKTIDSEDLTIFNLIIDSGLYYSYKHTYIYIIHTNLYLIKYL